MKHTKPKKKTKFPDLNKDGKITSLETGATPMSK